MTLPIEVQFSDSSWNKIVNFLQGNDDLKGLYRLVNTQASTKTLSLREVQQLGECLSSGSDNDVKINRLLRSAEIVLHSPPVPQRSKELEARVKKLKMEQQEREYSKMVENVKMSVPSQIKNPRAHVVSGLNFAITVVACVFATNFALKNILSDILLRCAIGFTVGIILLCIEIFLSVRTVMKQENEVANKKIK